jgi:hypothetical protein
MPDLGAIAGDGTVGAPGGGAPVEGESLIGGHAQLVLVGGITRGLPPLGADHVAEQIVAAAGILLQGLPSTGANVFLSRVYDVQPLELPCLLIDEGDEGDQVSSLGVDRTLMRTMELLVVAKVKQVAGYRELVNTIRKEVEAVLAQDNGLGGLCKSINPGRFELELDGSTDQPVASGTMRFEVLYFTALSTPHIPL